MCRILKRYKGEARALGIRDNKAAATCVNPLDQIGKKHYLRESTEASLR
jgi:hypothetical protein